MGSLGVAVISTRLLEVYYIYVYKSSGLRGDVIHSLLLFQSCPSSSLLRQAIMAK